MAHSLVEDLGEMAGDHLRSVAEYTAEGYEVHYLRDDVAERYTEDKLDEIYDSIGLDELSKRQLESLFDAGRHTSSMFGFEEALVFHVTGDDSRGVFVSVDANAAIPLSTFLDRCTDEVTA